jgi:SAM-dependent methyltransferase
MPTSPTPAPQAHQQRQLAESFGTDPARYDRTRPPYPSALVERIVAASPGRSFLDVGCGTGIAARQFQAAGCTVLGIEPDARMAAFARERGLDVEVAKFEDWEAADRTYDALVAATVWHWVEPAGGAAKAAQVLKPGGLFAAFWHAFDLPAELADTTAEAFRTALPDAPIDFRKARQSIDMYRTLCEKTAGELRETGAFDEPAQWGFQWRRTYTRDEWLDQLPTSGALTRVPPDRLAELLAGVGSAIDSLGGSFTMPYETVVVVAARTP